MCIRACVPEFALKSLRKSIYTHRGPQDQSKNLALEPSNFLNFAAMLWNGGMTFWGHKREEGGEKELKMFLDEVILVQKHSCLDCALRVVYGVYGGKHSSISKPGNKRVRELCLNYRVYFLYTGGQNNEMLRTRNNKLCHEWHAKLRLKFLDRFYMRLGEKDIADCVFLGNK